MRFDTVIFDLDGTLLYTLEGLHRSINFSLRSHGLPELIAIAVVVLLHLWKRQMLLSIAAGTVCYMLLVQLVF